jgi:clan AA aspartic protease
MLLPANRTRRQASSTLETVSYGEKKMGLVYADIDLISADDLALHRRGFMSEEDIKRVRVRALVDSGSYMLVVNEQIKQQLDLPILGETVGRLADESEVRAQIVGPVEVRFENRRATVDAIMFHGVVEPLLGAIPMEDMDVVIDPKQQRLIVNPESPYIARKHVK